MQNRCVDKIEKPFVVFSIDRIYPRLNLPAIRIMSTPFDVNTNINICYPPPPHLLIPDKQFWQSLSFWLRVLCVVSNRAAGSRLLLLVHLCSVRVQSLSSIAGGFPIFQCASFPLEIPRAFNSIVVSGLHLYPHPHKTVDSGQPQNSGSVDFNLIQSNGTMDLPIFPASIQQPDWTIQSKPQ